MDPEAFNRLGSLAVILSALAAGLAVLSPSALTGNLVAGVTLGFGIIAAIIQSSYCAGFQAVLECVTGAFAGVMLGLAFRAMAYVGWVAWLIMAIVLFLSVSLSLQFYADTKNFLNSWFGCAL